MRNARPSDSYIARLLPAVRTIALLHVLLRMRPCRRCIAHRGRRAQRVLRGGGCVAWIWRADRSLLSIARAHARGKQTRKRAVDIVISILPWITRDRFDRARRTRCVILIAGSLPHIRDAFYCMTFIDFYYLAERTAALDARARAISRTRASRTRDSRLSRGLIGFTRPNARAKKWRARGKLTRDEAINQGIKSETGSLASVCFTVYSSPRRVQKSFNRVGKFI